jgi:hypothetical protein
VLVRDILRLFFALAVSVGNTRDFSLVRVLWKRRTVKFMLHALPILSKPKNHKKEKYGTEEGQEEINPAPSFTAPVSYSGKRKSWTLKTPCPSITAPKTANGLPCVYQGKPFLFIS